MSTYGRVLSDLVGTLKNVFSFGQDTSLRSAAGQIAAQDYEGTGYIDLKSQRLLLDNNAGRTLTIDVDFATSGGYTPEFDVKEYAFSHETVSPQLLTIVTEGQRVKKVAILIEEAFENGVTLSVGHTGSANGLMATTDNDPTSLEYYEVLPNFLYGGSDSIRFYITGTSATGSGYVFLEIENTE